jgi:hypothetical protein
MLVGKMLVGEQPGARLGSLGLLFSGGVVALGLQGGPKADRCLAVHAAGVIRTGMFWSLGDPQRRMAGVILRVPRTLGPAVVQWPPQDPAVVVVVPPVIGHLVTSRVHHYAVAVGVAAAHLDAVRRAERPGGSPEPAGSQRRHLP